MGILKKISMILGVILLNVLVFYLAFYNMDEQVEMRIHLKYLSDTMDELQLFWSDTQDFTEDNSVKEKVAEDGSVIFSLPDEVSYLRIDFGEKVGEKQICEVKIESSIFEKPLLLFEDNYYVYSNDIERIGQADEGVSVTAVGTDPYCVFYIRECDEIIQLQTEVKIYKAVLANFICILLIIICFVLRNKLLLLGKYIYINWKLIWKLALNDFKTKYAASYLGVFWAFVQPVISILLYWFVFEVGLRTPQVGEVPFAIWLIAGLVPWFYHSDITTNVMCCFTEYSYLVKKILFPVGVLPVVRLISTTFVHVFFVVLMLVVYFLFGYEMDFRLLAIIYFSVCTGIYSLGLGWFAGVINVFFKDIGQIVNIVLQIFMWITPILWNVDSVGLSFGWIFKLNPMYYIVDGYRKSLFGSSLLSKEFLVNTLFFWIVTGGILILSAKLYRKLRPHFADVL